MDDQKYVVFKRTDWENFKADTEFNYHPQATSGEPDPIEDAVVIRTRDVYAGPALHAYAHAAITTLEFLPADNPIREDIKKVIEYFIEKASDADVLRFLHKSQTPKAP